MKQIVQQVREIVTCASLFRTHIHHAPSRGTQCNPVHSMASPRPAPGFRRAWASTAASAGPGKSPEAEQQRGTNTILTEPGLECWVIDG